MVCDSTTATAGLVQNIITYLSATAGQGNHGSSEGGGCAVRQDRRGGGGLPGAAAVGAGGGGGRQGGSSGGAGHAAPRGRAEGTCLRRTCIPFAAPSNHVGTHELGARGLSRSGCH